MSPRTAGRHSFATGLLAERRTLKEVQDAGRWKSIKMPALIYGHLELSKVDDDAREVGEKWAEKQFQKADVIAPVQWATGGPRKREGNK